MHSLMRLKRDIRSAENKQFIIRQFVLQKQREKPRSFPPDETLQQGRNASWIAIKLEFNRVMSIYLCYLAPTPSCITPSHCQLPSVCSQQTLGQGSKNDLQDLSNIIVHFPILVTNVFHFLGIVEIKSQYQNSIVPFLGMLTLMTYDISQLQHVAGIQSCVYHIITDLFRAEIRYISIEDQLHFSVLFSLLQLNIYTLA